MCCYNCQYLKEQDKKEGKINGSLYYCSKIKKYVRGSDNGCEKHQEDIMRKTYIKDEIYNDGLHYYNDDTEIGTYVAVALILLILAIIVNL